MLDRIAVERALNYYLQNHKPYRPIGTAMLAIPDSVNSEAALAQASDLLRCAGACANEAGNGLSGPARDLVLSVMHLVELAKGYVDKSLDTLATHGSSTRLSAAGASWDSWFEGEGVTEDFF
ncbi:DUF6124 family protein [Pseudomonas sp. NKUCC02_KPG]|uniref:DUF6124 family protein n=1 Tax=Pseudomonas sp. NKUCC02_KPG TaxID=2842124 RepID=UPI00214C22E6|nr:DUF3077 domain-containing protein [Pseudomonas sp. NKUCC02_KPG]